MLNKMEIFFIYLLFIIPLLKCDLDFCGNVNLETCGDLSCSPLINYCPSSQTCSSENQLCPDGKCIKKEFICPQTPTCKTNYFLCNDGTCVENTSTQRCRVYEICPSNYPIKCSSGTCSDMIENCPSSISCPEGHLKCETNDCVTDINSCPTRDLSDYSSSNILCQDGRIENSRGLCGTLKTCPIGMILCWNGGCATTKDECFDITNYACSGKIRCFDGSCRNDPSQCPSLTICPRDKPVKCPDNSCAASIYSCIILDSCNSGYKRCQDGRCAKSIENCETPITCLKYKCFDNTCRENPDDCPPFPDCPVKKPFMCPDGTCVTYSFRCNYGGSCGLTSSTPIKCPNGNCVSLKTECLEQFYTYCPPNSFRCSDQSCRVNINDCPKKSCPFMSPLQCPDGLCVSSLSECNSYSTGCHYNEKYKCINGACNSDPSNCDNTNTNICSDNTPILCPDGSCVTEFKYCYSVFGCPQDIPFRCIDGSCIDPSVENCSINECPISLPFKCSNGLCTTNKEKCVNSLIPQALLDLCNTKKQQACLDGTCVIKSELCRPLYLCPNGYNRYGDGSCRSDYLLVPQTPPYDFCEKDNQQNMIRCTNGACITGTNFNLCTDETKCPTNKEACLEGPLGRCIFPADSATECLMAFSPGYIPTTGCESTKVKCWDGRCVSDVSICEISSSNADLSKNLFYCEDSNYLVNYMIDCSKSSYNNDKCIHDFRKCHGLNKCELSTPFISPDGDCLDTTFYPFSALQSNYLYFPKTQCQTNSPFLCDDLLCKSDPSFCQPTNDCLDTNKFRCYDKSCRSSISECKAKSKYNCPDNNPILCLAGYCVDNIMNCHKPQPCPPQLPILCATGSCSSNYRNCLPSHYWVTNNIDSANNIYRCPSDKPYLCSDGSCTYSYYTCLISINGCFDSSIPYRCPNGECKANSSLCDITQVICASSYSMCEDGICRIKCPPFYGCPSSTPIQCPNGFCAENIDECAGESNCPLDNPFMCISGKCVSDFSLCEIPPRFFKVQTIRITVGTLNEIEVPLIFDNENNVISKILIPSGLKGKAGQTLLEIGLIIRGVEDSVLRKFPIPISDNFLPYVKDYIQYGYNSIDSALIVASAALNITTTIVGVSYFNDFITLGFFVYAPEFINVTKDYCLGRIDENSFVWKCESREIIYNEENKLVFRTNRTGIYAIIYNPLYVIDYLNNWQNCGWICDHPGIFLFYVLGSTFIIFFIIFSLFCVSVQMEFLMKTLKELKMYQRKIKDNPYVLNINNKFGDENEIIANTNKAILYKNEREIAEGKTNSGDPNKNEFILLDKPESKFIHVIENQAILSSNLKSISNINYEEKKEDPNRRFDSSKNVHKSKRYVD